MVVGSDYKENKQIILSIMDYLKAFEIEPVSRLNRKILMIATITVSVIIAFILYYVVNTSFSEQIMSTYKPYSFWAVLIFNFLAFQACFLPDKLRSLNRLAVIKAFPVQQDNLFFAFCYYNVNTLLFVFFIPLFLITALIDTANVHSFILKIVFIALIVVASIIICNMLALLFYNMFKTIKKRISYLVSICLIGVLLLFLWNRNYIFDILIDVFHWSCWIMVCIIILVGAVIAFNRVCLLLFKRYYIPR